MKKTNPKLKQMVKLFASISDPELMNDLFALLFTQSERDFLETRYSIIEELIKAKLTQREIAKKLNVSIAKITAGSKAIQDISDPVKKLFL